LITIYGSNLAPSFAVASQLPFPATLNGVQVNINNRAAPVYYVSQNAVSVIVPYATELTFAQIQIINNNAASNTVTVYMDATEPGVFTNPVGGLGYAAALHADYSLVSPSNPARIGETISLFVTGLGDVSPTVSDGAPGPASPFSQVTNQIAVSIGGASATVGYAGLAPGLAGLYQLNVTVPSGISSGDVYVTVLGPDSYSSEALLTIAGASSAAPPAVQTRRFPPPQRRQPFNGAAAAKASSRGIHPLRSN
jgi:uncharacterized protein (TIGR03437 family)